MMRRAVAVTAVCAGLLAVVFGGVLALSRGSIPPNALFTVMNGAKEVPGPGDADGTGAALVTLQPGQGRVCVDVRFAGLAQPTAMHIHKGAAGVQGGVYIDLSSVLNDVRCVAATPAKLVAIRNNPSGFYLNIHTTAFPDGAIRGQLKASQF
jgi:hypothetical protein